MENCLKEHEFIVFALDHYNPLGVVRSLGEAGVNPILIAVKPVSYTHLWISSMKCFLI